MIAGDHLLYSDEASGILKLSLESRSAAVPWHVASERCASELEAWLQHWGDRHLDSILVGTFFEHHGDLDPVVDVLVRRRPQLSRLYLGAASFPDFDRGSYVPSDRDRDGSSWRLSFASLGRLLAALPSLTELVVHTSVHDELEAGPITAPSLRRLVVRSSSSQPTMAALGRLDAPALETLEIWNPDYAYGWGGKAADLAPLLNNSAGAPDLRHLALVTDVGDDLVDAIAACAALPRLAVLDLSHGTVGDRGATQLRRGWAAFAHLERLVLTGNGIGPEELGSLCEGNGKVISFWQRSAGKGDEIYRCSPPATSILTGLLDGWHQGHWQP